MTLRDGDSWEAYDELVELFAEAGGTSNHRFTDPIRKQMSKMANRLKKAGVKQPSFSERNA